MKQYYLHNDTIIVQTETKIVFPIYRHKLVYLLKFVKCNQCVYVYHGEWFWEFIYLPDNLYLIPVFGLNLCCKLYTLQIFRMPFKEINNFYKIKETIRFMDLQIKDLGIQISKIIKSYVHKFANTWVHIPPAFYFFFYPWQDIE